MLAGPRSRGCARARARPASGDDVDRDDVGAAPRGFDASAPVPQPASSTRAPRRSSGSQDSSVARISSRPARTVARMRPTGRVGGQPRPGIDRGAVEVGLQLAAAFDVGGGGHQSNPSRSKMSRSLSGVRVERLGAGPQARGQAQILVLHGLQLRRRSPSRTASTSSAGCGGSRRDPGNARASSARRRSLNLSIWSVPALRLAITPPSRTP